MKNPGTAYNDSLLGKDPQPAHMKNFVKTTADSGGVHINSGIHTLAAVNVLRGTDASGARHFTPAEVAGLYYGTLQRLTAAAEGLSTTSPSRSSPSPAVRG